MRTVRVDYRDEFFDDVPLPNRNAPLLGNDFASWVQHRSFADEDVSFQRAVLGNDRSLRDRDHPLPSHGKLKLKLKLKLTF